MKWFLNESPKLTDLFRFSKIRLRKKRSRKKFAKNYSKYVNVRIAEEFLVKSLVMPLRRSLKYGEIGKKLLMVDQLPDGHLKKYEDSVAGTFELAFNSGMARSEIKITLSGLEQ
jgi:hypothetical protein